MGSAIDEDSIYCEFNDDEHFVEYYDLTKDPWQLNNAAPTVCRLSSVDLCFRFCFFRCFFKRLFILF